MGMADALETSDVKDLRLIRKRYLPEEEVDISGDKIVYLDKKLLVTDWTPIKPRGDMGRGISYWFLEKGWKISKIYNTDGSFKHYYCDICRFEISEKKEYKIVDLLVDIIIDEDGKNYKILDFEELTDMLEAKKLPPKEFMISIKNFSSLLKEINDGNFPLKELEMY